MFPYCLAYMLVHTITGLETNATGVCERYVQVNVNSMIVKRLNLTCCPDFYLHNGACQPCYARNFGTECKEQCLSNSYGIRCKQTCNCSSDERCHHVHGCICKNCSEPCPAGNFGSECIEKCQTNFYGVQCKQNCNCSTNEMCHSVHGCICKNEKNCSARIGVAELNMIKSKILNSTNDWLQTTNIPSLQEDDATFQHMQLYTIIIAAVLLLVAVAAVSVKFKRSACK